MSIDANEIMPRLWQGSRPPPGEALHRQGFTTVVLCAEEHQPAKEQFPYLRVLRVPLGDSTPREKNLPALEEEWKLALRSARRVADLVARGETVLVTCNKGRNRSGLVNALAVMLLKGVAGADAVQLVRRKRKDALTNDWFVLRLKLLPQPERLAEPAEFRLKYGAPGLDLSPRDPEAVRRARERMRPPGTGQEECDCPCHKNPSIIHMKPCCKAGRAR